MSLDKTTSPYEFLVRWGPDGLLRGAHVQFRTAYTDSGVVVSEQISEAQPVDLLGSGGFPLADLLSQITTDALATANAKTEAAEQADEAAKAAALLLEQAMENIDRHVKDREDLERSIKALQARVVELEGAA